MLYPIVTVPAPLLREKTKPVDLESMSKKEFRTLIEDMQATMHKAKGVGIAATQIGKSIALAIVDSRPDPLILINPKIRKYSWGKEEGEEGCLSVPGHFDDLKRAREVEVEMLSPEGDTIRFTAKGFFARVIQHEIDHLNGILFIDRIKARKPTGHIK